MFLRDIKRALRGGFHPATHPHKFGNPDVLGEGSFRRAYKVGDYVVKQASHTAQLTFRVREWNARYGVISGEEQPIELNQHDRPTVPYKQLRRNLLQIPQQWFIYSRLTGWWQVQVYYRKFNPDTDAHIAAALYGLTRQERNTREVWSTPKNPTPAIPIHLDLHEGNFGVTKDGKLVAFDW